MDGAGLPQAPGIALWRDSSAGGRDGAPGAKQRHCGLWGALTYENITEVTGHRVPAALGGEARVGLRKVEWTL